MMWLPLLASFGLLLSLSSSALALTPDSAQLIAQQPTNTPSFFLLSPRELRQTVITLERTPCFGFCPIYKLTISGDGKVVYEGKQFVKVKGTRTGKISTTAFKQLLREFQRAQYFNLADSYGGGPTDAAYVITSITSGGKTKSINHYLASPDAPQKLTELENKIDAAVKVQRWVGTNAERIPQR